MTVQQWLQIRKHAAEKIDPATAEVMFTWADGMDPYGVYRDTPEELCWIGREFFARSPGGHVWVWFGDLPVETATALFERTKAQLLFPAGLGENFDVF